MNIDIDPTSIVNTVTETLMEHQAEALLLTVGLCMGYSAARYGFVKTSALLATIALVAEPILFNNPFATILETSSTSQPLFPNCQTHLNETQASLRVCESKLDQCETQLAETDYTKVIACISTLCLLALAAYNRHLA